MEKRPKTDRTRVKRCPVIAFAGKREKEGARLLIGKRLPGGTKSKGKETSLALGVGRAVQNKRKKGS